MNIKLSTQWVAQPTPFTGQRVPIWTHVSLSGQRIPQRGEGCSLMDPRFTHQDPLSDPPLTVSTHPKLL